MTLPLARHHPGAQVFQLVPTVILAVIVVFAMPVWPWSRGWSWAPAGMLMMGLASLVLFSYSVLPE